MHLIRAAFIGIDKYQDPLARKGGADDPLEALSGSNGLSACADSTLVLDRDQNGITLYVRGRDVEEKESAVSFVGGYWNVTGQAADVRRSDERGNILVTLEEASGPMSPSEIADVTGMKNGNIRKLLTTWRGPEKCRNPGEASTFTPKNAG